MKKKAVIEVKHVPTDKIPDLPGFPFRIHCRLCGNTIVACEEPIPKKLRAILQDTPCSKCVSPKAYLKELESKRKK